MSDRASWSDDELRASVEAYIDLRDNPGRSSKAAVYRELSARFPARNVKSFERRMMNISHVFAQLGRGFVPGLLPAPNVGAAVFPRIERLIHEVEGRPAPITAAFTDDVEKAIGKAAPIGRPAGNVTPRTSTVEATVFDRDPKVVAYVLQEAGGVCEVCAAPAPFTKPGGLPYLEVHHLRRLADGGSDTVGNAVACCPNCHRELHYGAKRSVLLDTVYGNFGRLVRE